MKKRNAAFGVITCISALVGASGCGMIKNLNDMHDATNNMNEQMKTTNQQIKDTNSTTTHMSSTTDHLSGTSDHMAQTTDGLACTAGETYSNLRQGNTLQSRAGDNSLDQMDNSHAIEKKIFHAGAYMKAFEFQIWNCSDPDSAAYLKTFYMEAAQEFTRVLPNYLTSDKSKWSVSVTSTANLPNDIYALSASLQELNANIVAAWKLGKWADKPQSMLDLIEDSLTRKTFLAAHPDQVTLADHEFLANEDQLVQLFQIRMNFLSAMALAKVSNLEQKGFLGLPGLLREIKQLTRTWEPNLRLFGNANDVERIKEFTRYLYGSNDMNAYLRSIGVQPVYDSLIRTMYAHMRVSDAVRPLIAKPGNDADLAFNNTQLAIKDYLEQLDIYYGLANFTGTHKAFQKVPVLDHPEFYSY